MTRISISTDVDAGTISRHIYGHFAEHLGRCIYDGLFVGQSSPIPNTRGIRNDVVEALKHIHIPNLRWPGGCFADEYHWMDGIGPPDKRPTMLNTYWGLSIPLIASATATFMFRQVFLTIPDELLEAARIDGAGPMRFFIDILLPLSRTNIAALFVILFIYGWNQYLWPLLITTDESMYTILIGINRMLAVGDSQAEWQIIMATTMLAMVPPVAVVVFMQKMFVQGMTETEK